MTDEERLIIRKCLDGNRGASEVPVHRYESHVKTLHLFDPDKNFKNWLLSIDLKRSIDRVRKQKPFLNFISRYAGFVPMAKEEIRPLRSSQSFW